MRENSLDLGSDLPQAFLADLFGGDPAFYYRQMLMDADARMLDVKISQDTVIEGCLASSALFRTARREMVIFGRDLPASLDNTLYYADDDLLAAAEDFVARGGRIRVLLRQAPNGEAAVAALVGLARRSGGVRAFRGAGCPIDHDFTVADARAYRLGLDDGNRGGTICFNDRSTARRLTAVFDRLWSHVDALPVVGA